MSIYFEKESADIIVNLFVEETYQTGDYIKKTTIPANIEYVLNSSKSSCKNNQNEGIEATISYVDGYINIGVSEVSTCDIYLDKNNE